MVFLPVKHCNLLGNSRKEKETSPQQVLARETSYVEQKIQKIPKLLASTFGFQGSRNAFTAGLAVAWMLDLAFESGPIAKRS